jgi:hypothetical protein
MHVRLRLWMYPFAFGIASFMLSFPVCASTLSTSVTCGDLLGSQSTSTACTLTVPDGSGSIASASVSFSGGTEYTAEAHTNVTGPQSFFSPQSSAMLVYDEDLTYTITGYTGTGFVQPLFFVNAYADPEESSDSFAQVIFGSIEVTANLNAQLENGASIPFTFGVPFTTHLQIEVTAGGFQLDGGCYCGGGTANVEFASLDSSAIVTLANGQPAPDAFIFSTPEPSTLSLFVAGVALLALRFGARKYCSVSE